MEGTRWAIARRDRGGRSRGTGARRVDSRAWISISHRHAASKGAPLSQGRLPVASRVDIFRFPLYLCDPDQRITRAGGGRLGAPEPANGSKWRARRSRFLTSRIWL